MLSVKPDRPIEPAVLSVLATVARVADELGLRWCVTGAMARNILLSGVFGFTVGRATRDVDLAVAVANWNQFEDLKEQLLQTALFQKASGIAHRLHFTGVGSARGYPLDIVPFGGVEQHGHLIAWPPARDQIMSVAGYEETLAAALEVQIAPGLTVRVASLPGLAVLKILAWADRRDQDSKDAADLVSLFRCYFDAGNADRLYGDQISVLEAVGFDVALAGPRLLGRDVRTILAGATAQRIRVILDRELDRLVTDLARYLLGEDPVAEAQSLLEQFRAGICEDRDLS